MSELKNGFVISFKTYRITSSKAIIGRRSQVIHAYDSISDESIWSILINHLPILSAEVRAILDAEE